MNTTINLKKENGESFQADLISYFELNGKKYVFYTLNEAVENNLVKMYVSQVGDNGALPSSMTDEEWASLKVVMKAILTGNADPGVKYLRWEA